MKLLDTDHPFFRPLWIRILIVLMAGGWAVFEFWAGSVFWGAVFLAFCGLSVWGFFIDYKPEPGGPNSGKTTGGRD